MGAFGKAEFAIEKREKGIYTLGRSSDKYEKG
jgi:hypothetical protein